MMTALITATDKKIFNVYRKLPGVVHIGTAQGRGITVYDYWLISMGMYVTLNILTGREVEYGGR